MELLSRTCFWGMSYQNVFIDPIRHYYRGALYNKDAYHILRHVGEARVLKLIAYSSNMRTIYYA